MDEVLLEELAAGALVVLLIVAVFCAYLWRSRTRSKKTAEKIEKAKEVGLFEPVSLYPHINEDLCIGVGACVRACPEKDVLGLLNGKGVTINASRCVGHGACFHACPTKAISLVIGTERRGVELPYLSPSFETNVPGIFIAGELGGMGLIRNAVEQGREAVDYIDERLRTAPKTDNPVSYDVAIIGAGPAGISAALQAVKKGLSYIVLEQDNLGGTVFNFPRAKIVMTSPMTLPMVGRVKLRETSKTELLSLWQDAISKHNIVIHEQEKVEDVKNKCGSFDVVTSKNTYSVRYVLLATGRRGSPRKLGVPGEEKEKVYYRLLEAEHIHSQRILVVGGGDSAIESALLLADEGNTVTLSYRGGEFSRLKEKNLQRIMEASGSGKISVMFSTNVGEIQEKFVILENSTDGAKIELANDLVYIFAGGELPSAFLNKIGVEVSTKHGEAILRH